MAKRKIVRWTEEEIRQIAEELHRVEPKGVDLWRRGRSDRVAAAAFDVLPGARHRSKQSLLNSRTQMDQVIEAVVAMRPDAEDRPQQAHNRIVWTDEELDAVALELLRREPDGETQLGRWGAGVRIYEAQVAALPEDRRRTQSSLAGRLAFNPVLVRARELREQGVELAPPEPETPPEPEPETPPEPPAAETAEPTPPEPEAPAPAATGPMQTQLGGIGQALDAMLAAAATKPQPAARPATVDCPELREAGIALRAVADDLAKTVRDLRAVGELWLEVANAAAVDRDSVAEDEEAAEADEERAGEAAESETATAAEASAAPDATAESESEPESIRVTVYGGRARDANNIRQKVAEQFGPHVKVVNVKYPLGRTIPQTCHRHIFWTNFANHGAEAHVRNNVPPEKFVRVSGGMTSVVEAIGAAVKEVARTR